MKILSHRGLWGSGRTPNSAEAFEASFALGFGTETDLRDHRGRLVVSHDPPDDSGVVFAETLFEMHAALAPDTPLALNIKADGLQRLVHDMLQKHSVRHSFLFDMSIPDTVRSLKQGLPCFTRQSDIERIPVLGEECAGVWMDAFRDDAWITPFAIREHLDAGRQVCLVSPELHGRDADSFWQRIRRSGLVDREELLLCTDRPCEAAEFFAA